MTCDVRAVDQMPFWKDLQKRKRKLNSKATDTTDQDEDDNTCQFTQYSTFNIDDGLRDDETIYQESRDDCQSMQGWACFICKKAEATPFVRCYHCSVAAHITCFADKLLEDSTIQLVPNEG